MAALPTPTIRFARAIAPGRTFLCYTGLALAILFPLLAPGYVLAVDMVFVPAMPLTPVSDNTFPLYFLLHYLSYAVPAWVIQKVLLFALFVAAGMGAHRLIRALLPRQHTVGQWPYYFAGILYACNPFVYTRFMTGQYLFLLGYAAFPFFVLALRKFLAAPSLKTALQSAALLTLIAIFSLHALGLALLLAGAVAVLGILRGDFAAPKRGALATYGSVAVGVFVLANSYWIMPALFGNSAIHTTVSSFTSSDLNAFRPVGEGLPVPLSLLAMQGFWADAHNLYLLPQDVFSWWLVPILLLWGLAAAGVLWSWRRQRALCVVFIATGALALLLASGTATGITAPLTVWLSEHIPFFAGYREPQRFISLLVLAFAYFGSAGIVWIRSLNIRYALKQAASAAALALPILLAPLLLWGGAGQLKATDYPESWYAVDQFLQDANRDNHAVLFLPWHLYMPFNFTEGVLANPAEKFFQSPVLTSNDPEIDGANGYAAGADVQWLDRELLPGAAHDTRLAGKLAHKNIRYVLLAKEFDYKKYEYLRGKDGFTIVKDTPELILYHVREGRAQ